MANSLLTGVSGLLAHSRMLEVTGNNLANVSTTGYKAQRVLFSDMVYETLRSPSDGAASNIGGVNPSQVGAGSIAAHIDRNFRQSSLELTGGAFDAAIEGDGFFVVNNGQTNLLTRAGTFGLDANQFLVDQVTGFMVQRYGTVGEGNGTSGGFQIPGDASIRVPLGATVLGQSTEFIDIAGNLSADAEGPRAAVLTTATAFTVGGVAADLTTRLNNVDDNATPYVAGDSIEISGFDYDGAAVSTTFAVDTNTTLGDLVSAINGAYSGAVADVDAGGNLTLTAGDPGETALAVQLADSDLNSGGSGFDLHSLLPTTVGSNGDIIRTPVEFFDTLGGTHVLELAFQRRTENQSWDVLADMDPADGTLSATSLGEIRFNEDGSFQQIVGNTSGLIPVTVTLSGQSTPQTVQLRLQDTDGFEGLTQAASGSATRGSSDGYAAGTLYAASISQDGVVVGLGTNGRHVDIAQLSIGSVQNNGGLSAVGENQFVPTVASGQLQMGAAQTGSRGRVLAGQLESSNVDLAYEFTRLIVAQRGFSANARTITVTDEVLEEVTNIIR